MTGNIILLVFAAAITAFCIYRFLFLYKKTKSANIKSVATVSNIIDLGFVNGKKGYAVKYEVKAQEPFEILETPVNKKRKIGKTFHIMYEKDNPKENHYIYKHIKFDKRIVPVVCGGCFGVFAFISVLITMIFH